MSRPAAGRGRNGSRRSRPAPARRPGAAPALPRRDALSPLEVLLDASAAQPAPAPRDFAQLGLPAPLVTALARRGFSAPFAIQARALPDALAGRDVLGRAQTGSGKTLAFGLAVLARLASGARPQPASAPRALILTPTRELASQVADELARLADPLGLRVVAVYGGAPMGRQIAQLRRGADIVVATPGRLQDLIEQKVANLAHIEVAVLDEADHMADLGFLPAVTRLLDATPEGGQRLLFSATLDRGVDRIVQRYLTDPAVHAVESSTTLIDTMEHRVFTLRSEDKVAIASAIAARPGRTLFFVRTKHGADRLAKQMVRTGAEAVAIHGNLNQNQRERALRAFAAGQCRVLVATDVAARGIHVDDVDLVVHFDPPNDHKDYLHRSGRTARAGAAGTVVSLVEPSQVGDVSRMHAAASVRATSSAVDLRHPDLLALASSGEPIRVTAVRQPAAPGPAGPSGRRHRSGGPRRPDRGPAGGQRRARPAA
jgi:superfamily II DNA/RNA helicase